MARTASTPSAEILKDRRVQIGIAIVLLLIVAAVLFLTLGGGTGGGTVADSTAAGDPGATGYPGGDYATDPSMSGAYPGGPGDPAAGGIPGIGGPGTGAAAPSAAAPGAAAPTGKALPNSFTGAPKALAGAGAAPAASPFGGGGYPGGGGFEDAGASPFGGAAAATPTAAPAKPAGVRPGVKASAARTDPFVTFFRRLAPAGPPAYAFAVPLRLASVPRPKITNREPPEVTLGPLPVGQRRVAGILYNGAVSAILETGAPGERPAQVVQPGSLVPSGIVGLGDLTVESIAPTRLILRSEDGRRAEVGLTGLPPGAARVIGGGGFPGGGGDIGGGGYPGGGGGFPGGGGGYPGGGGPAPGL